MFFEPVQRIDLLRKILRPVIRFCVKYSISVHDMHEAVNSVFVDLAVEEISARGEKVNVSRISVLTGLNRRECTRLRAEGYMTDNSPGILSRVVTSWAQDSRFRGTRGQPRVLKYEGPGTDFKKLVASISTDVGPLPLLKELLRLGAVTQEGENLRLRTTVADYNKMPERALNLLTRDIESLCAAAIENLENPYPSARNLHARTEFDNVFIEDIPKIRTWLLKQGMLLHKKAREYLVRFDKDLNPTDKREGGGQVVLGSYSHARENAASGK